MNTAGPRPKLSTRQFEHLVWSERQRQRFTRKAIARRLGISVSCVNSYLYGQSVPRKEFAARREAAGMKP